MQKSPWPWDLRSLSGILGWSCWCLDKTIFCMTSAWFLVILFFFRHFFSDGWRYPGGSSGSLGWLVFWLPRFGCGDFFYLPRHGNGNSPSSNGWGFPVVTFSFRGFFQMICWDCLVEVVLAPNHPVLKERMSSPVLQKLPWRKFRMISCVTLAEGCRSDLNDF